MDVTKFLTAANLKSAVLTAVGIGIYFKFVKPQTDKYLPA